MAHGDVHLDALEGLEAGADHEDPHDPSQGGTGAEERARQKSNDQDTAGQRPGGSDFQCEPPLQVDRQPEASAAENEEERGFCRDGGPHRRNPEELQERAPGDRRGLADLGTSRLRRPPQRLAEPERQDREDQPRNGGQIEGGSPAECAGDDTAPGEPGGNADRGTGAPDRHGAPTALLLEVVAK